MNEALEPDFRVERSGTLNSDCLRFQDGRLVSNNPDRQALRRRPPNDTRCEGAGRRQRGGGNAMYSQERSALSSVAISFRLLQSPPLEATSRRLKATTPTSASRRSAR